MGYVGKVTAGGSTHLVGSTLYGTCNTAAGTAAKVVTCADFTTLITGVTIHVKFTNSNSVAKPTLNVNSTGAKNIYRYGTTAPSTSASTSWNAGAVVAFTYDGNYWQMNDWMNTDGNNAVTQTATNANAAYEVLFSVTADNTTRTEGARKNSNLTFNPSTGNLTVTQINGVTVGSSPKFTDANTTYSNGTGLSLSGTTFSVNLANNATTTAAGYALDARMGKTLNDWMTNSYEECQNDIASLNDDLPLLKTRQTYELYTWAMGCLYDGGKKATIDVKLPIVCLCDLTEGYPKAYFEECNGYMRFTDGSGFIIGDGSNFLPYFNVTDKSADVRLMEYNNNTAAYGIDIRLAKSSGTFGSTKALPFIGPLSIKFSLSYI